MFVLATVDIAAWRASLAFLEGGSGSGSSASVPLLDESGDIALVLWLCATTTPLEELPLFHALAGRVKPCIRPPLDLALAGPLGRRQACSLVSGSTANSL